MIERFLTFVSHVPILWNWLRWLAEAGYRRHHTVIDAELDPWRLDGRRFLDFGCGTGQFAAQFPPDRYTGVDLTRAYIEFAAGNRRGQFAVMNGAALGFRHATFGGALVLGVFHHLPDDLVRDSMEELHTVLGPGATLLVIEDVPPPTIWNLPGHFMHMLDRGDHIRTDADYRALFAPHFLVRKSYGVRSGVCDYGVYVLEHNPAVAER